MQRCALRAGGGSVPTAETVLDRAGRQKALAAMVRAGHGFELARAVVEAEPGTELDVDDLQEKSR